MFNVQKLFLFFVSILLIITSVPSDGIIQVKQIGNSYNYSKSFSPDYKQKASSIKENKLKKKMLDPVMIIRARDSDMDAVGNGTGFSFKYDAKEDKTYILTNEHVCASRLKEGYVLTGSTSKNQSASSADNFFDSILTHEFSDPVHDLCVLSRKGFIQPVKFSDRLPSQMDKIITVGAPAGRFPIIVDTYFSGYMPRAEGWNEMKGAGYPYLILSEIFHGGVSGSPVYDEKGRVIGVIFANMRRLENGMFTSGYGAIALQTAEVKAFLTENGLTL